MTKEEGVTPKYEIEGGKLGYLSWCSFKRAQRDDENDVFSIAVVGMVLQIHDVGEHGVLIGGGAE